jgi:hypothetical protein
MGGKEFLADFDTANPSIERGRPTDCLIKVGGIYGTKYAVLGIDGGHAATPAFKSRPL